VALSLTKGMRVVVTGRLDQRSWETEDGDKRFKIEIVADEIGPALRFATVDVHRVVRPAAEPGPGSFSEDGVGA
jgi:single-strand DNA-binding protein